MRAEPGYSGQLDLPTLGLKLPPQHRKKLVGRRKRFFEADNRAVFFDIFLDLDYFFFFVTVKKLYIMLHRPLPKPILLFTIYDLRLVNSTDNYSGMCQITVNCSFTKTKLPE